MWPFNLCLLICDLTHWLLAWKQPSFWIWTQHTNCTAPDFWNSTQVQRQLELTQQCFASALTAQACKNAVLSQRWPTGKAPFSDVALDNSPGGASSADMYNSSLPPSPNQPMAALPGLWWHGTEYLCLFHWPHSEVKPKGPWNVATAADSVPVSLDSFWKSRGGPRCHFQICGTLPQGLSRLIMGSWCKLSKGPMVIQQGSNGHIRYTSPDPQIRFCSGFLLLEQCNALLVIHHGDCPFCWQIG